MVAGLACLGMDATAQGRPEKNKLTLAVSGKAGTLYYLPLTIAEQLGFFTAEGLEVDVIDSPSGARAQQALSAGTADVVCGPFEQVVQLWAKHQPVVSFVQLGRAPQIAFGLSVKSFPQGGQLAELKGRNIGVLAPASASNVAASLVLGKAGLRSTDVNYIGVGAAAGAVAALRSGQIDALCNMDPLMTQLEQRGELRIVADTRTLKGTLDVFGGPMPGACLFASADFVQRHPLTVQALSNGIIRSLKWLQNAGPSDLNRVVPEPLMAGDRAAYLTAYQNSREAFSLDGLLTEDAPSTALRVLSQFEPSFKLDKVDLTRTYTNDFARRAKDKFRA
jgi:NitT/TauT family transport system substrate-binding protein